MVENRISVIIPNYNHELFLEKRIQSVLNQSIKPFEVIILDDASTDGSCRIIDRYMDYPNVIIKKNITNSGSTFAQWKKGISIAKGELIWIAESDDFSSTIFLETLLTPFLNDSKVVISYCNHYTVDTDEKIISNVHFLSSEFSREIFESNFILDGIFFIENYLIHKNVIPNASGVLFRKDVFQQLDEIPKSVSKMGDWLVWLQILSFGKIAFSTKKLNYFRNYEDVFYKRLTKGSHRVTIYGFELRLVYSKFLKKHNIQSKKISITNNRYISLDIGNMGLYEIENQNILSGLKKILKTTFWPQFKSYYIKKTFQILFNVTKGN